MKNRLFAVLVLLGILFGNPIDAGANNVDGAGVDERATVLQVDGDRAVVTFESLGFREATLVSPFDSTRVLFSIPPNWRLAPGGEVVLDYEITLTGLDAGRLGTDANPYGGSLQLSFNNQFVGSIPLTELGGQSMRFQLPATALDPVRRDGRHQLVISLSAQFSCLYDIRAIVVIKPSSTFELPFEVSTPNLDLSRLPGPFYLRNALLPDRTLVVVPDEPEEDGLKAALNVMAGFGSMIGTTYDLGLVAAGELADQDLASSNLVFVGGPDQFDRLDEVEFPVPVKNGSFVNLPSASNTDGVVELAVSPWNPQKVVMLVSGDTPAALTKAAQAVSSGRILVYENPALAYVADVQLLSNSIPVIEDFTLQDIGYRTETISGVGENNVHYLFNVAKEQIDAKDATIDLMYYHSGLLNYGFSSFSVELNNQIIASSPFSKESEQLTTMQLRIPPGLLRFGENRLTVTARLLVETSCDVTGFSDPWLTISDQSMFHLPASPGTSSGDPRLLDLKFYPDLFLSHSDLGDVAFVLPRSSPAAWRIAGRVAYGLGRAAIPLIANLDAVYSEQIPEQILSEKSLIVIGRASKLPFINQINEQLPAPFDLTNDTASERQMQIIYRIPEGVSVGYLELLNSPFNDEKHILVVAGNTDNGVLLAGDVLRQAEVDNQLAGVFAVTNGTQIGTGNVTSFSSIVGTVVPPGNAVITTPMPDAALPDGSPRSGFGRPGWLLPLLVISGIVAVVVVAAVATSALAKRRADMSSGAGSDQRLNGTSGPDSGEDESLRS